MADYLSAATKQYLSKAQTAESSLPNKYQSKWQAKLDQQLQKIVNREKFKYDFNADPIYQQYKDQYVNAGKKAMMDTVGQVSALTGGYGNSYAATAGSQSYQEYLKGLNDRIPELYNAALNKYKMEGDELYQLYDALGSQDDREYAQYQGDWDRAYNLMAYYADQYNSAAGREQGDYQFDENMKFDRERAAVEDSHWDQDFAFNRERATVEDSHWDQDFAFKRERASVEDSHWAEEMALRRASLSSGGGGGGGGTGGGVVAVPVAVSSGGTKSTSKASTTKVDQAWQNAVKADLSTDALRQEMFKIKGNKK